MSSEKYKIGWGFGKCNMFCEHCYNASTKRAPVYSLAELKNIVDKNSDEIADINFGTGEFSCNPNVLDLARYIRQDYPEILQSVTSNGYTLTQLGGKEIKNLFNDVDVSIDFPDRDRHNQFRNHKQAWAWAIKSLEISKKFGIKATITTCITSLTSDEDISGLLAIAKKYNVAWRINWFRQVGRGKGYLRLKPARVWEIIRFLSDKVIFESISDPLFTAILGLKNKMNVCGCGRRSCRIRPDLTVTPCVFLGEDWVSEYSITQYNLSDIFESKAFYNFRSRLPSRCRKCHLFEICEGGCSSRAILHNGDINTPDDYCPIATGINPDIYEDIKVLIDDEASYKVHDGYLCTLIMRPI